MKHKVLFKLIQDEDGYPPVSYESLWAIQKGEFYLIDNIPFYVYEIALGDVITVEKKNNEFWFKDVVQKSTNSTIRLYCSDEILWTMIKAKLEKLECRWETTLNSLKAISVSHEYLQSLLSFLNEVKKMNIDFDYEDAALR